MMYMLSGCSGFVCSLMLCLGALPMFIMGTMWSTFTLPDGVCAGTNVALFLIHSYLPCFVVADVTPALLSRSESGHQQRLN
jgi:hypothetical protein